MIASYNFWKWADNDLPGRPAEVHASLLRGDLHPALQPFDARPLMGKLEQAAAEGRRRNEEWDWRVTPEDGPEAAHFVFVTCPMIHATEASVRRFNRHFSPLGLSGCEDDDLRIIPCLPPKLNCFLTGQLPYEPVYDITPDDLPWLIRRINGKEGDAFGILELARRGHFVQCYAHGRRYSVEWACNDHRRGTTTFDQWRAQDRKRLAALQGPYHRDLPPKEDPDLLTFTETMHIFETFLRGAPRPARQHWMNINRWLDS